MKAIVCIQCALLAAVLAASFAHAQEGVYNDKIRVTEETRLDWAYPLLGKSPAQPAESLSAGYHSIAQSYEFFGPAAAGGGELPLVIFVSPSDRPVGWYFWEPTCRERGVLFAGVRDMGNGHPTAHRVRAVLDVLDDVRARYPIDPDRTYLVGFSGGAAVACLTALALPEHFGGVVCVGHAPELPRAPWQLERVKQRLSVAIINGDGDPATPFVEDHLGPWWQGVGVRVEPVILRRHGHTMPDAEVFASAYEWLEEGVGDRRAAARKLPSLRVSDTPSRIEWSERVLADAKSQLASADAATIDAGLQQLAGIVSRWEDVPAAATAKQLIADYASRKDRPWEAAPKSAERATLQLAAEGFDALAQDGRPPVRDQRGRHARTAIALWKQLSDKSANAKLTAQADERIAALTQLAAEAPAKSNLVPANRFRFDMEGDVTLAQAIEYTRKALSRVGYTLEVDNEQLRAAGVDLDKKYKPRLKAVTLDDLDRRFFRRAGLRLQRIEGVVRIVPIKAP